MLETATKRIFTITELTREVRYLLEEAFPGVWVEGEVSNLRKPSSGHMYFTLKDANAQLNGVMFRGVNQGLKFKLEDGMQVVCFGNITVYERSGQYQLSVKEIEPKGIGALQIAFEQLKKKLQQEGLFDEAHKVPIPYLPGRIGVVTSPTGAAIRDILNIAQRRFQNIDIILSPVKVQGDGAAEEIAQAIRDFNEYNDIMPEDRRVDVLIVGRGGGSMEDLWAFNEEAVARAIYNSEIPIISAVGHEIDWTIADFVADKRAPTPSAAAELIIPEKDDLKAAIDAHVDSLKASLSNKMQMLFEQLERLSESYVLKKPLELVLQQQQRVDDLSLRLSTGLVHFIDMKNERFKAHVGKLDVLSPLGVLSRGYSITAKLPQGVIIKDVKDLAAGDRVRTKLANGVFVSKVEQIN